jgi:hypothetical protein
MMNHLMRPLSSFQKTFEAFCIHRNKPGTLLNDY